MRRCFLINILAVFILSASVYYACADSAPVDKNKVIEITNEKNINVNYAPKDTTPAVYYSKEISPKEISRKKYL